MAEIKRRPNWTEEERIVLIDNVNKIQHRLFGKFKGCGTQKGGKIKEQAWEEVVNALNAKSGEVKRTVEEAKKQYANLKQRAKDKSDAIRRPKTGGGPKPVSPSFAETLIIENLQDRPTLQGLLDGFDTEDFSGTLSATTASEDPGLGMDMLSYEPNCPVQLDLVIDKQGILQVPTPSACNGPFKEPPPKKAKLHEEEILTLRAEKDKFLQETITLKEQAEYFRSKNIIAKLEKEKLELEILILRKKCATLEEE
ncbi:uncharacterized protein [Haliotis cracherodii]|uniref:uncharacterized protein n=1 Tax=Haliotis cracherodii TaxID=6455 RepID=UPI0039E7BCDE